jgi:hypothetical protein
LPAQGLPACRQRPARPRHPAAACRGRAPGQAVYGVGAATFQPRIRPRTDMRRARCGERSAQRGEMDAERGSTCPRSAVAGGDGRDPVPCEYSNSRCMTGWPVRASRRSLQDSSGKAMITLSRSVRRSPRWETGAPLAVQRAIHLRGTAGHTIEHPWSCRCGRKGAAQRDPEGERDRHGTSLC